MPWIKELFAKFLRLRKVVKGIDKYINKDISISVETKGNEYASWTYCPEVLNEKSIVYSFGVGDDISFDLSLINQFDVQIFAFDPTPKSIDWIKSQNLPKQFVFHESGLADFDGKAKFFPPKNPNHISASMLERAETKNEAYKVEVKSLQTIMLELGHHKIDLMKMDIEGEEYHVIEDMRVRNIRPGQLLIGFHHHFKKIGVRKTVNAVNLLHNMGYLIFNISSTGEEISFIRADLLPINADKD